MVQKEHAEYRLDMIRKPISSSNLKSVGFDPQMNVLEIEFQNGIVHQYHGVDGETHERLVNHPSPGAFFHASVRQRFKSTKVDQNA